MKRASLRVVSSGPAGPPEPEEALRMILPELIGMEQAAAALRRQVDHERSRLARKRGVAFIREEHVRKEFSGR